MTGTAGGHTRRSFLRQGVALSGVTALGGCLEAPPEPAEASETPRLVAHKGCAAEHPENTVPAVSAAAAVADAVEVDVRRCRSGELVAFHDERLGPVTDETGHVNRRTCSAVLSAEVLDSGATVPTLQEVFDAVPSDVGVVLDLKEPGLVPGVRTLLDGHGHDVLVSSDRGAVLDELRSADPAVETAYIVRDSVLNRGLRPFVPGAPRWLYLPEDTSRMVRTARELGCTTIHPRYELCLRTDLVARAHRADLRVEPWTTTGLDEVRRLAAVGVDGVISDVCREAADYLG